MIFVRNGYRGLVIPSRCCQSSWSAGTRPRTPYYSGLAFLCYHTFGFYRNHQHSLVAFSSPLFRLILQKNIQTQTSMKKKSSSISFKILTQLLQSALVFTDEQQSLTRLIGPHSKEKFYQVVNKMMQFFYFKIIAYFHLGTQ